MYHASFVHRREKTGDAWCRTGVEVTPLCSSLLVHHLASVSFTLFLLVCISPDVLPRPPLVPLTMLRCDGIVMLIPGARCRQCGGPNTFNPLRASFCVKNLVSIQ